MMDEVDKILAQDPAEKEVAELAAKATPVSAQPAKSPAGAPPPPLGARRRRSPFSSPSRQARAKAVLLLRREVQAERGLQRHSIATCNAVPEAFDPAMIPAGHYMVRTDSIGTPPARKPAPPPVAPTAPEEDKDSSTGHEGDGSEDPGTAGGTAGKGPTPDSSGGSSRGAVDEDDVRRSKRPHRRSEDVEAIIQAEHPGRGAPKAATQGQHPGCPHPHAQRRVQVRVLRQNRQIRAGLKKHVTSAHLDKRENWIIEDEVVVVAPAAPARR